MGVPPAIVRGARAWTAGILPAILGGARGARAWSAGILPAILGGARAWSAGVPPAIVGGARASCPQLLAGDTCECKPLLGVLCGLGCAGSALPTIATGTVALLLGAHHRILSCMFHLRTIAGGTPALHARAPPAPRAPCPRSPRSPRSPRASSDCTQHFQQIADWENE